MEDNSRQTVLVTGGAGNIGSACVQRFCDEGYRVVVLDNLSTGKKQYVDSRAIFEEGDILDESVLAHIFKTYAPRIVVHLAARKVPSESERYPERYIQTNVVGTCNVLTAAAQYGIDHFMFSSTAGVYKENSTGIYTEEDVTEGTSVYGNTKLICETLIKEFCRTGRIPAYTIFRYFNVAGDAGLGFVEEHPQNLVPLILRSLAMNTPLKVYGTDYDTVDGSCVRDYIHVSDIADAHVQSAQKRVSGIFNLGTNQGTSVLEMIALVEKVAGSPVPHEVHDRRSGDIPLSRADATKAQKELTWEPRFSVEDMITSMLKSTGLNG